MTAAIDAVTDRLSLMSRWNSEAGFANAGGHRLK